MTTITQNGYEFIYRNKVQGQPPVVETWGIERVSAFIFLIEFYRLNSQRYMDSLTLVSAYGSIQYELEEFDKVTYHDVDKLSKLLMPYTSDELRIMWYTSFDKALGQAERMIKERIEREEADTEVFGEIIPGESFLSRPSKEVYDLIAEKQREALRDLAESSDSAVLKVWFAAHGIIPCVVVKETNSWYWVDGYKDGEKVVTNSRVKKGTSRIIEEMSANG